MTRRPRLLIDVDGPLTDGFFEAACALLREQGVKAHPRDIKDWNIFKSFAVSAKVEKKVRASLRGAGVASAFKPRHGAREFLAELRKWADVYAVTAPLDLSPTWAHEREEWLVEKLGFEHNHIISARHKRLIKGDILIDDKIDTITEWQTEHPEGLAVLWRESHNAGEIWPVSGRDYDELRRTIAIKFFAVPK